MLIEHTFSLWPFALAFGIAILAGLFVSGTKIFFTDKDNVKKPLKDLILPKRFGLAEFLYLIPGTLAGLFILTFALIPDDLSESIPKYKFYKVVGVGSVVLIQYLILSVIPYVAFRLSQEFLKRKNVALPSLFAVIISILAVFIALRFTGV